LVVDTTYFGKRREATELDGVMVFIDAITGQVIWAKFIKSETNSHYQEGLNYLESRGFEILGAVSDGRRGLARIFSKYPYQICQFHIQKGVSTLLTRNPKSITGKELKQFNDTFIKLKLTKAQFLEQIETYLKIHQGYLNEMSETDPKQYKHQRLRKALKKYKNNLKYMFTCQANSQLQNQIPNTTNKIDGGVFSQLKRLLNNHSGLNKIHRKKWIIYFLNSKGKSIT
jgi:tRNA-dihydrouridine synthase